MAGYRKKGPGRRKAGMGKRAKRAKPTAAFSKKVKKVMNSMAEVKQAYKQDFGVNFNSGIDSAGDVRFVLPAITNGVFDNARIGDQIRGRSLRIKGVITSNLTFQAYSNCRLGIRMMVVQPKTLLGQGAITAFATTWLNSLLKKGGTTVHFAGNTPDLFADLNKEIVTVMYDKVYYVNTPYMVSSVGNAPTVNSTKFFDISMPLRNKIIRYDSAIDAGITPTNFNPVLLLGYCHLDGSGPDVVSTQVSLTFDTIFNYSDF